MKALSFHVVAALMVVGFFAGAGLRADDDAAKSKDAGKTTGDLKKLQGTWTAPSGDGGESVYTFKDNKPTGKAPTRTYQRTVTLDESAKPHKTIDLKIDEAPEDAKGKTV